MPSAEDIQNQRELLQEHRRTLRHYLKQKAIHSSGYAPPAVERGIQEARDNIQRIKLILRGWNVIVEDDPDDESIVNRETPSNPPLQTSDNQAIQNLIKQTTLWSTSVSTWTTKLGLLSKSDRISIIEELVNSFSSGRSAEFLMAAVVREYDAERTIDIINFY